MIERRSFQFQAKDRKVSGYGILWNSFSFVPQKDLWECFKTNAFGFEKRTDLCLEHEKKVGVADILSDPIGLKFDSKVSSEVADMIKEKRFEGASVQFDCIKEHRNEYGARVIEKAKLHEISLVKAPVYKNTLVELRSKKNNLWEQELKLLELEL